MNGEVLSKVKINESLRFYIPDGTKRLNSFDFEIPKSICSIVIPKSVISIERSFFSDMGIFEIINYSNVEIEVEDFMVIKNELSASDDTSLYVCRKDFIFIKSNDKFYLIKYIGKDEAITLPERLIIDEKIIDNYDIADDAFRENEYIRALRIPGNVKNIGKFAFNSCDNLVYVLIDEGVEYIRRSAFAFGNLEMKISIPESLKRVESYSIYTKLVNIYGNCTYVGNDKNPYMLLVEQIDSDKDTVIHPDCKLIQGHAFDNSKFESIIIPSNVKYIASYAFQNCKLKDVVIESSDIAIGIDAFLMCDDIE